MTRGHTLNNILILSIVLCLVGCKPSESARDLNQSKNEEGKASNFFKTRFQDESQFVVETTVAKIAEQVFLAKHHSIANGQTFSVRAAETANPSNELPVYVAEVSMPLKTKPVRVELKITRAIWCPDDYAKLTQELAGAVALNPNPRPGTENTELLDKLASGLATTIERENQALSAALERDSSDWDLHERAALLIGAFALREHSGLFSDARPSLCQMAAHLAVARFLRGTNSFGLNGQVAEVMLYSLMNNQAAALAALNRLQSQAEPVVTWARVLKAWNTGDYRPMALVAKPRLVERVAWFQAFSRSANAEVAWGKVTNEVAKVPDYCRIAEEESCSVEVGHYLSTLSVPTELAEIAAIYELAHGKKLTIKNLVPALNEIPEQWASIPSGSTPRRIIEWPQWAMFFQRHLCQALVQSFDMLDHKLGMREEALDFSNETERVYGSLRLYPFVRRLTCRTVDSYHRSVEELLQMTRSTPHLVPFSWWKRLFLRPEFAELYRPGGDPHVDRWFKHVLLPGTAYDAAQRFETPMVLKVQAPDQRLSALHTLAPYDTVISSYLLHARFGDKPTYEHALELFEPTLPFASSAIRVVASTVQDSPSRYEELMLKMASFDASVYSVLGDYFSEKHLDDKAAAYYEKAEGEDPDTVTTAAAASWRVSYYLKSGQREKARHVADLGAEVYSQVGLEAKAEFHEAIGEYTTAAQWYKQIEERYDDSQPLMAFCSRYESKTGDRRFAPMLQKRQQALFPKGMEKVSLAAFKAAPTDGALIGTENERLRAAGLKRGDVIVAVNGVRIHNFEQYLYARDLGGSDELSLIVWQGGYRQIKASPPQRRFGVDFDDYSAK